MKKAIQMTSMDAVMSFSLRFDMNCVTTSCGAISYQKGNLAGDMCPQREKRGKTAKNEANFG